MVTITTCYLVLHLNALSVITSGQNLRNQRQYDILFTIANEPVNGLAKWHIY